MVALSALLLLAGCHRSRVHQGVAEWTRFRGPNGSGLGVAPNLPAQFSAADFNWKVELPGTGHSSPAVWGDRIFVTANPPGTAERLVLCLSAADGKKRWQKSYKTPKDRLNAQNSYAASTPAVDAERLYFHWASPAGSGLVALDQDSGRELWKVDLGPFVSEDGPGTSPIMFEDMVILNFDQDKPKSFLLALDARTGRERWRWEHEGRKNTPGTPCILMPKGGAPQVALDTFTLGVCGVEARTGKLAWQLPGLMKKRCVASTVVTESGLIVAQCGEGPAETFVEVVRPPVEGKPAERVYEVLRNGGHVPTPIAVHGLLFLWKENGFVTCLRADTGEQLWYERAQGAYYSSPVCVNDRLYNITNKGDLVVIAAAEKFQQIARIPLGEGSSATPAISGGRMYLRTYTHLISVGK